jgi:hypothetical protein
MKIKKCTLLHARHDKTLSVKRSFLQDGFLRCQNDSNYRDKKKDKVASQQKVTLKLDDAVIEESILLYN